MPNEEVKAGRVLAAGLLGIASPWVWAVINFFSTYITLPLAQYLIQSSRGLDISRETWRFAILAGDAAVWAIACGLLLGLPLGFFAVRRVWLYSLVFAVGAFVGSLLASLATRYGVNAFLLWWSYPGPWVALIAVACFSYLGVHIRNRVERRDNAARYRLGFAVVSTLLIAVIGGGGWLLLQSILEPYR
jgi:hypothetical protein